MTPDPITLDALETTTLGFLVFLVGARLTRGLTLLQRLNIPEPVTGGILAALCTLGVVTLTGRTVSFDLVVRDYLLVLFFSGIGLNARMSDLARGGRPLAILLGLTAALILLQNSLGVLTALAFGLPGQVGLLLGSVSLIGGHGTTIAWAPEIARVTGFAGAMELGIASATLGLVIAALIGGPLAGRLIARHRLQDGDPGQDASLGLSFAEEASTRITPADLARTMMVLHAVILAGSALHEAIVAAGLTLPLFVPCLLVAILVANLLERQSFIPPVAHRPALALVSDFALGTFLAMSLMAMQLWTLQGMGLLMVVSLALQTALALGFILLLLFPLMGGQYLAAVLSAGFAGFALGATPTAIANMNAVTKTHGPAPLAFVILPLVSAFFVDLANTAVIQLFLLF
jgi:ESS family glutamate:Na+ symporter